MSILTGGMFKDGGWGVLMDTFHAFSHSSGLSWIFAVSVTRVAVAIVVESLKIEDSPVKPVVCRISLTEEEVPIQPSEILVIWLVVKSQGSTVVEVSSKLHGKVFAQKFNRSAQLFFCDLVVLFFFSVGFQTLPGQRPAVKIH